MKTLWGIVVAISHEWKGIRPLLVEKSRIHYQKIQLYDGEIGSKDVVVVVTGMGPERAAHATRFLLQQYPITHLLSTGYCGALNATMKSGDAVVVKSFASSFNGGKGFESSPELVQQAQNVLTQQKINFHVGRLLTSATPIFSSEQKKKFAEKFESIAVDMESYSIGETVSQFHKEIPFITVRFIFDELSDVLPESDTMNEVTGEVKPWPLVKSVVKNPVLLKTLPVLGQKAQLARKNLVKFIQGLFEIE